MFSDTSVEESLALVAEMFADDDDNDDDAEANVEDK